jgi:predicted kinase
MSHSVELHLVCGKVAAGKSTFCARLAEDGVVRIEQDQLMANLYPEMETVADYVRLVPRLRAAIGPLVVDMLKNGLSVVLDWPANTIATRSWMRELAEEAGATARLHWLATPDDLCLDRLTQRNAAGTHDYQVSPEEFAQLSAYFEPPSEAEGMEIVRHAPLGT